MKTLKQFCEAWDSDYHRMCHQQPIANYNKRSYCEKHLQEAKEWLKLIRRKKTTMKRKN